MTDSNFTLLARAFEGLIGQSVSEWRNGYGDSGSFHIGRRIPERSGTAKRDRGTWVLTIWAASVSLSATDSATEVSHHPPLALKELRLDRLTGMRIEGASVNVDGKAILNIGPSTRVEITPTDQAAADEDQWTIETDELGTYILRVGPKVIKE